MSPLSYPALYCLYVPIILSRPSLSVRPHYLILPSTVCVSTILSRPVLSVCLHYLIPPSTVCTSPLFYPAMYYLYVPTILSRPVLSVRPHYFIPPSTVLYVPTILSRPVLSVHLHFIILPWPHCPVLCPLPVYLQVVGWAGGRQRDGCCRWEGGAPERGTILMNDKPRTDLS